MKKEFFEKNFWAIKILISIIVGFLPSFIFIALFIQYGSPFTNYINFLLSTGASWIAWISALVIGLFTYFVISIIQSKHTLKRIIKNKFILIVITISLILILSLIITQISLYINFITKNDLLVKLSADNDNIFFTNNTQENISFKISLAMNPFCSAECKYEFFDISNGNVIDSGAFNMTSILSKTKQYEIENENLVQGSQTLKRFEVKCSSQKTFFCYTNEEENGRAVLITINYELTNDEKIFKNDSQNEILSLEGNLSSANNKLNESLININLINNSFSEDSQNLLNLKNLSFNLNNSIFSLRDLWEKQYFDLLKEKLLEIQDETENFYNNSEISRLKIISDIFLYNNLTENFTNSEKILNQISQESLTPETCSELNNIITDFNDALSNFTSESNLQKKQNIIENISAEVNAFYEIYNQDGMAGAPCSLTEEINSEIPAKINIISLIFIIPITNPLVEPVSTCCFLGNCQECCDERCSKENYPILFLHGSLINKALPADYSLDAFAQLKEKIVNETYIDVGAVVISSINEPERLWGKVNTTVAVTGSYFFDTYKTGNKEITVPSTTDSIDTYAIRLKNIIDLVKYRTGKDKVIIITQSMGGLVTRRYIQIFGGDSVDKAILITVPNHGTEDKVTQLCGVLGPEVACNEMDKNSIFMNQLNNAPVPTTSFYNIIGIGCNMGDETGDGIIKNSSQYLEYATNYYINGKCNELNFEFFHEFIIYPNRYPNAYNIIEKILNKSE